MEVISKIMKVRCKLEETGIILSTSYCYLVFKKNKLYSMMMMYYVYNSLLQSHHMKMRLRRYLHEQASGFSWDHECQVKVL